MTAYLEIPFAFLLQHLMFGDAVGALDLVGSALILAMGVLSIWLAGKDAGAAEQPLPLPKSTSFLG